MANPHDGKNRLLVAFTGWKEGVWHAVTREVLDGRRFAASAESEISDPTDREGLANVEAQLKDDLLTQLEQAGYPRELSGVIIAFVDDSV